MKKEPEDKFEVLFVCTGNTCRSPMAEGILKKMLAEKGIKKFEVGSAGICSFENAPVSLFARQAAGLRKIDLSQHHSRQLTAKMLKQADLVLAMSQKHLDYIRSIDPQSHRKASLLKAFARMHPPANEEQDGGVLFIKDPIGGRPEDYERSFVEIETELRRVLPEILRLCKGKTVSRRDGHDG
ncbi:MAG: low molecular weight protein arginine phosphatase [Candidatus Zixiibacteriota bacterium]